jgi:outer membrane lipoprotein carrier protein
MKLFARLLGLSEYDFSRLSSFQTGSKVSEPLPIPTHLSSLARFGVCLAIAANSAASSISQDVLTLSQRVDRHYNALHTLEAEFVEKYRGNGIERTESGTLWIKRPGRMRWEYREPRAKLFITDGTTAWFYAPGDQQARSTPSRKLDDLRSPLAYLLGKAKLERVFEGLRVANEVPPQTAGGIVIEGKPKGLAGHLARVLLEVSPAGRIERIVAEGQDDSVTEYQFLASKEDVVIADERFRFVPPAGVEVVTGGLDQ